MFWHSIWPLRSSGAHWAGQVPGWGPAVHIELGRSQVSGAHWAGKAPGWAAQLGIFHSISGQGHSWPLSGLCALQRSELWRWAQQVPPACGCRVGTGYYWCMEQTVALIARQKDASSGSGFVPGVLQNSTGLPLDITLALRKRRALCWPQVCGWPQCWSIYGCDLASGSYISRSTAQAEDHREDFAGHQVQ